MLSTHQSLVSVAKQLRVVLAGSVYSKVNFAVLSYDKELNRLRLGFYADMPTFTQCRDKSIILVTYYAPGGDWDKWYGDDWCWILSTKRIALDIMTSALTHINCGEINGYNDLPSWLRADIETYL